MPSGVRFVTLLFAFGAACGAVAGVPCDKNHYILGWNCDESDGVKALGPVNHLVGIGDDCDEFQLCFYPTPLTIRAGDSVTFFPYNSNGFAAPCNVVADDGSFRCANGCDGEGGDGAPRFYPWQFTRTFNTPGVVEYHDERSLAKGVIEVRETGALAPAPVAIEYVYKYYRWWGDGADRVSSYFVSAFPEEIAALDAGGLWWRTGESFNVWSTPAQGTLPACRFLDKGFGGHFYAPYPAECTSLMATDDWKYEGTAFHLQVPDANGDCPTGTTILLRLYNESKLNPMSRYGGGPVESLAPLHRYTTRVALFDQLRADGWVFEGDTRTFAFACVPSPSAASISVAR